MARDSERLALYNGLRELLGQERADTLMAYLPSEPAHRLVHKEDVERFELRLNARMEGLEARMDRFEARMGRFEERMDRLFLAILAILAGLIGVIGTLVAAFFAT